jgi:1-acyl-sn-glycerol-3-phosphate acyltransferase
MSSEEINNLASDQVTDEELRQQLVAEVDELVERVQAIDPEYQPPPFSAQRLVALIEESLKKLPRDVQLDVLGRLKEILDQQWLSMDTWKGIWYMLNYTAQYNLDVVKRRFTGEYDTDAWGLDWEMLDVVRPFLAFLYKAYWRVETTGLEHVPVDDPVLLVANHAGQLPWDGLMITTAVMTDHPAQRLVRTMYGELAPSVPFVAPLLARVGQTLATVDNGVRLLEQGEAVVVFPEGYGGMGKTFRERYKLARFGQVEFVEMALRAQAPIIPVAVVGAEETYISLANSSTAARLAKLPYVPVTPTFPWLGVLGLVPLPTKWYIDFGQPIRLDGHGPEAATNLVLVSQLGDRVRNTIQEMLYDRLAQRRSVFF